VATCFTLRWCPKLWQERVAWAVALLASVNMPACGHHADLDQAQEEAEQATTRTCEEDADCDASQICSEVVARRRLAATTPCDIIGLDRPPPTCAEGYYCEPVPVLGLDGRTICGTTCECVPNCVSDMECPEQFHCTEDGPCAAIRCDAPEFEGCAEGMVCDPDYVWPHGADPPGGLRVIGTDLGPERDAHGMTLVERHASAGCVVIPCDEENGVACAANYQCGEPEEQYVDSVGCVPTPCEENGELCSSEEYLCTPTRLLDAELEELRRHDVNGCAVKNCEDPGGPVCEDNEVCLPERAPRELFAFDRGCASAACAVGQAECAPEQHCDPMDVTADSVGCVSPEPDPPEPAPVTGTSEPDDVDSGDTAAGEDIAEQTCSRRTDCPVGYCVDGRCASGRGQCRVAE
jgi:hypothetical protein